MTTEPKNDIERPDDINDLSPTVRRHHTISSGARRGSRAHPRMPPASETAVENEDEVVGNDWVGSGGVVGDGKGLHRQSSLPSKYSNSRAFRQPGASSGTVTPSRIGVNSLSAITAEHGAEDQEEELWGQIRDWKGDDLPPQPSIDAVFSAVSQNPQLAREHSRTLSQSSHSSSISPMIHEEPPVPPLPVGISGVRRHQSLTYGHNQANSSGGGRSLGRAATIGKTGRHSKVSAEPPLPEPPYVSDLPQDDGSNGHVSPQSSGRGSAGQGSWVNTPTTSAVNPANWSQAQNDDLAVDDLQRNLSGMGIDSQMNAPTPYTSYYSSTYAPNPSQTLSQPPPNPNHNRKLSPAPMNAPRFRSPSPGGPSELPYTTGPTLLKSSNQKLSLVTSISQSGANAQKDLGPVSAAAYVPPPGGGLPLGEELGSGGRKSAHDNDATPVGPNAATRDKPMTATGVAWDQKERIAGSRDMQPGGGGAGFNPAAIFTDPAVFSSFDPALQQQIMQQLAQQQQPQQPPLPGSDLSQSFGGLLNMNQPGGANPTLQSLYSLQQQLHLLQQQQMYAPPPHNQYAQPQHHGLAGRGGGGSNFGNGNPIWNTVMPNAPGNGAVGGDTQGENPLMSPVDVQTLASSKGYNPTTFDCQPPLARFFVIKSFTEDDVHKSLKYEIWSSTEPGNKRLDKAFKETNGQGPIYLFFSVNGSGHFCGVAEMLTPVDYTRSSTVWAQDKWKGVIKVKWIFVRDVPNPVLRHIKLTNTQEQKPVTNSRDTQELPPEAGQEMLRIFVTHPSRTSLLQDFGFYELQSLQRPQGSAASQTGNGTSGTRTPPQQYPMGRQGPPNFSSPQGPTGYGYGGQSHPGMNTPPRGPPYRVGSPPSGRI